MQGEILADYWLCAPCFMQEPMYCVETALNKKTMHRQGQRA